MKLSLPRLLLRVLLPCAGASVFCLLPPTISHAQQITGYTPASAARQKEIEAEVVKLMSAPTSKALSREFARDPHMAGTPGQERTRDLFAKYLKSYGITTEIQTFSVYMPHPTNVRLYRVSPDPKELSLIEGPVPEDSSSTNFPQSPAFNGYSGTGDVTAELVYVNYGLIEDYKTLDSLGISVKGKIAIARYGKSYRGIKAREAEKNGAVGLIIYSDPQQDGYTRDDVYPEGPMRPDHGVQRGSIFNGAGDPTTPGYASIPGAPRIDLDKADLSKIPVVPISYKNATELLSGLRGAKKIEVPQDWQGALPFRYHVGPGPVKARLVVENDAATNAYKNIYNVLGVIRGTEFPDDVIVIGGHRDSWNFGAADNVSGTVSVIEAARTIGELMKRGIRPKRTIVFAAWDAEEWGLIGSVEYVENDTLRLTNHGVAYLNQDMVAFGSAFNGSGSPSLRPLLRDVTRQIPHPDGKGSIYDAWRIQERVGVDSLEPEMGDPGGGSDFEPFYSHIGMPIAEWGFGGPQGIYHSLYDTQYWMDTFGDSSYRFHSATGAVGAAAVLRLANADILPYDYTEHAKVMRRLADEATRNIEKRHWTVSTVVLTAAISEFEAAAREFNATRDAVLQHGLSPEANKHVNSLLLQVDRAFVRSNGLVGRPWARNVIFAADNDNGYDNIGFPTINEAVRASDQSRTALEVADLATRFESATQILLKAAQTLR